jgi:SAM-dependent methyltransferase
MTLKLNIGCDYDYKEGWINLDNQGNPDVLYDLNIFPYPFKDNTFDVILANHVLEHLDNPLRTMQELWRISKDGAEIIINVPYFNHYKAYADLTHKKLFTWKSFDHLADTQAKVGYVPKLFKYKQRNLIWGKTYKPLFKPIVKIMNYILNSNPELMEKRFPFIIPAETFHVELIAQKQNKTMKFEELDEENIYEHLQKSKGKYLMNPKDWKRLRLEELKKKGRAWPS